MRGYAMSVDSLMAVGGFYRPGDRVDIYWTSTIQNMATMKKVNASLRMNSPSAI